nr:hypothetical protein [Stenotrophomonas maltophilia]
MSGYEIKVSITPLCPSCGKESQLRGFIAESRAPNGVFDRDNPYERTSQRVFISPCNDCFVHRSEVEMLIDACESLSGDPHGEDLAAIASALARVKGGSA